MPRGPGALGVVPPALARGDKGGLSAPCPPPPATSNQQPSQQPSQQASKNFLPLLSSTLDPCAEERRPYSTDFPSSCFFYYCACCHVLLQKNEGHIQPIFLRLFFYYYTVFTTAQVLLRTQPDQNRLLVATRACYFGANKNCVLTRTWRV